MPKGKRARVEVEDDLDDFVEVDTPSTKKSKSSSSNGAKEDSGNVWEVNIDLVRFIRKKLTSISYLLAGHPDE
jgi:hypothetical protein